jgi:hypothetical protein
MRRVDQHGIDEVDEVCNLVGLLLRRPRQWLERVETSYPCRARWRGQSGTLGDIVNQKPSVMKRKDSFFYLVSLAIGWIVGAKVPAPGHGPLW